MTKVTLLSAVGRGDWQGGRLQAAATDEGRVPWAPVGHEAAVWNALCQSFNKQDFVGFSPRDIKKHSYKTPINIHNVVRL